MPMTCGICTHESRNVIDAMLAAGSESQRVIAGQFGLTQAALQRHAAKHLNPRLIEELGRQALVEKRNGSRREGRELAQNASRWVERLEEMYSAAKRGVETAEGDEENWFMSAKFIAAGAKLIETGLKVEGFIEGGGSSHGTQITIEQVLILPQKPAITHSASLAIETTCESEDDES